MRNLIQATLYPGIGAFESTNISVGRGTDTPFEQIGAPWIDGVELSDALNGGGFPGIRFYPVRFTPAANKHSGQECQGVFMVVTDRAILRPVRVGVEIAALLQKLYGSKFELDAAERLFGSKEGLTRIRGRRRSGEHRPIVECRREPLAAITESVFAVSLTPESSAAPITIPQLAARAIANLQ